MSRGGTFVRRGMVALRRSRAASARWLIAGPDIAPSSSSEISSCWKKTTNITPILLCQGYEAVILLHAVQAYEQELA